MRFGQWEGAFMVHRILRGDQEERRGQVVAVAVHGHGALGHGFEEGRLRTRRGAVDFIGQQNLRKDRAGRNSK